MCPQQPTCSCAHTDTLSPLSRQTVCKLISNCYLSHLHWTATRHIPGPPKGSGLVRGMRHHVTSQLISRRAFLNIHKASQTKQHLTKCPHRQILKTKAKYSGPSGYTKRAIWHSYLSHSSHKILWVPTVCQTPGLSRRKKKNTKIIKSDKYYEGKWVEIEDNRAF